MSFSTELARIIISSSDPEELKNKITKEFAIKLKALSCFFIEYDLKTNSLMPIKNAYNTKRETRSLLGYDIEENLPSLATRLKYLKYIFVEDTDKFIKDHELENSEEAEYYKDYDVKAILGLRLEFSENFLGLLILHYEDQDPHLHEVDIEMLKDVAEHTSIALYLSKLYIQEKNKKEKEVLLREIISIIGSSNDFAKIKQEIVTGIGLYLRANRVFWVDFDLGLKEYQIKTQVEYKSDEGMESIKKYDFTKIPGFTEIVQSQLENGKDFIVKNIYEYEKNFCKSEDGKILCDFFKEIGLNTILAINIHKGETYFGNIVVTFSNVKNVLEDDIDFVRTIAKQAGFAANQSKLYIEKENQIKIEKSLFDIINKIRSSLDTDQILNFICNESIKIFNVQRSAITVKENNNSQRFVIKQEVTTDESIPKYQDNGDVRKHIDFWTDKLLKENKVYAIDYIENADTPDFFKNLYIKMGIKSAMGAAIKKGEDVWGTLVLSDYNHLRTWSQEEKDLLVSIADQVYIAINQAELYEKEKAATQRERILREITNKIRSSLDFEKIKHEIVTQLGVLLNVERVVVGYFDHKVNNYIVTEDSEYRSSEDVKSFVGIDFMNIPGFQDSIKDVHIKGNDIIFNDIEEYLDKHNLRESAIENFFREYGYKSSVAINIYYKSTFLGDLVITNSQLKVFTDEDITFLKAIADQVGVAFHQAELFQETQIQAAREKMGRSIIEILRSSNDKIIIKKAFVRHIGKFLNANRVFICDFDNKTKRFSPTDAASEYLSNENVKSFSNFDWNHIEGRTILHLLTEKREIKIPNIEDFITKNNLSEAERNIFGEWSVKSSYSFPIIHQDKLLGTVSIEYTEKNVFLTEEEITNIRNICTQLGIALYQAELYDNIQNALNLKSKYINKVTTEITYPVNAILQDLTSFKESKNKEEKEQFLDNIEDNCQSILSITKEFSN